MMSVIAIVNGQRITSDDMRASHRARHERLVQFRRGNETRRVAVRVIVRYYDQMLYGGWHCYIERPGLSKWVRKGYYDLFRLFPLSKRNGQDWSLSSLREWDQWKQEFALAYPCGTFDGKPRGIAYCWAEQGLVNPDYIKLIDAVMVKPSI